MNIPELADLIEELGENARCGTCYRNCLDDDVEIPDAALVLEKAYNLGLKKGIRTCTALVRSEPTTGAGLVKEVDDCIDKIEDTGMKESYRNARLAMKGLGLE
ncbi:MAG: hypothetical protein U1D67_10600 [Dehalococcoidia bacterium]|nr:hypothetical protein [Dehalococcoidia bacterium]